MTPLADSLAAIPNLGIKPHEPLARYTTFRIGGPAELLIEVPTQRALQAVLRLVRMAEAPLHVLGF